MQQTRFALFLGLVVTTGIIVCGPAPNYLPVKTDSSRTIESNWSACEDATHDKNCLCDEQCTDVGDCCSTFPEREGHERTPVSYTCVHTTRTFADDKELEKYGYWFQAIADCPETSSIDMIARCQGAVARKMSFLDVPRRGYSERIAQENQLLSITLSSSSFRIRALDVRSMAPVVARRSGRVYANIDCANCHGDVYVHNETLDGNVSSVSSLKVFPVQIRCRTYSFGDRLCYAATYLPAAFRRPCLNVSRPSIADGAQPIYSLTTFKWHEFLVLPDLYLNVAERSDTESAVSVSQLTHRAELIMDVTQVVICILSALSLLFLIVTYMDTKELRSHASGQITLGLSGSLFGLLGTFLFTPLLPNLLWMGPASDGSNHKICMTFATLMHYFFLNSFLWMAAFGVSLLRTFGGAQMTWQLIIGCVTSCCGLITSARQRRSHDVILKNPRTRQCTGFKGFLKRATLPTILPLLLVIPAIVINERYHAAECTSVGVAENSVLNPIPGIDCSPAGETLRSVRPGFCPVDNPTRVWFTNRGGAIVWFFAPTMLLLGFNCLVTAIVGVHIWNMSRMPRFQEDQAATSLRSSEVKAMTIPTVEPGQSPAKQSARSDAIQRRKLVSFTRICINMSIILGLVWLVQLLANLLPGTILLRYFAGLLSATQGLLVTMLSFSNPKARGRWQRFGSRPSSRFTSLQRRGDSSKRSNPSSH